MPDTAFHPLDEDLRMLDQVSRAAAAPDFLRMAIRGAYRGTIALVVSDGGTAMALLHMIAGIDRNTPVIVLGDAAPALRLGLRDVRTTDALETALDGFEAWIDGREAGIERRRPMVAIANGRLKLDPLAAWRREAIDAYLVANDLPRVSWQDSAGTGRGAGPVWRAALH